ncbi:uncharacterized protein LAESUDRAFT_758100 [Laetiporus sulphureus 93-53]|uniref:BTB domain-containing protein n=1 Tax=Laetiporus sulphureus 93-53 TaxID=1314785 RepID=A0A165EYA0_9APHY|nr:uncharacterized protein LAESUDRAFT_758100 [Laetiporus sulphureus 93-53]KZT07971.1 hypothetical protein LAESUDRAFT_758100 [Laetiporus sulphureus 93-53]
MEARAEASSSRKRKRIDGNSSDIRMTDAAGEHDGEFWFDDGNIILSSQGIGFRVYRGLLAQQSDVFQSVFTLPQPADSEHVYDCPVVQLSDHPQELRHLLRVLLYGWKYLDPTRPIAFDAIASLIRLSHKYEIQDVLNDALWYLRSYYTDSFSLFGNKAQNIALQTMTVK